MDMNKQGKEEEEEEEDWCFECKEGGLLLVCDYKDCPKSYHADCVSESKSVLKNDDPWFCRRHSCYQCQRSSKYQCFGCPNALCKRCIVRFKFAPIRGNKGLCHNCSKLALLGEEGLDVDSDGELVDFEDLETEEGLFFDYWKKVVKVKEGLTLEDLQSAEVQIKKGAKYKAGYKLKHSDDEEEFQLKTNLHDDDADHNIDDMEELCPKQGHKRKRSDKQKLVMQHGPKSKNVIPKSKHDLVSWASNGLIDFLASVGEDTSSRHEPYKIASIINRYADENKLINPEKPRKIVCDVKLKCLFGKKMVDKNKLVDLVELHFPENIESSEEEIEVTKDVPAEMEKKSKVSCKNQRSSIKHKICEENKESVWVPQWRFALIVSENIKLVYLKKSLVQDLFKQPETFLSKIIGSFVRVKLDQGSGSKRYSLQLLPVTGINITSKEKNHPEFYLQVSTLAKDISINMLSDDNFTEEECEELKKKVKDGLIPRITIVELEQKARLLHDDITKHWIVKELATLQNIIDKANEKGWRREFFVCSEKQRLLQTSEEQSRLLRKVPNVIPDVAGDAIASDDVVNIVKGEQVSGESMLPQSPKSPGSYGDNNVTYSEKEETKLHHSIELDKVKNLPVNQMNEMLQDKKHGGIVSCYEGNYDPCTETCFLEVLSQPYHVAAQVEDKILFECELSQNFQK